MRRAAVALMLIAATACSSQPQPGPDDIGGKTADGHDVIACALGGAADYASACVVERRKAGEALELVVRHPDGGFRRLVVLDDGSGLAVADGAKQAVTRYVAGHAEVAIDHDRYRFPATERKARTAD